MIFFRPAHKWVHLVRVWGQHHPLHKLGKFGKLIAKIQNFTFLILQFIQVWLPLMC